MPTGGVGVEREPGPRCVLLIEDRPAIRSLLTSGLVDQGLQVLAAADGEEAGRVLAETRPDLIVTDLLLPGPRGDGFIAGLRARPETREIPVIVISGLDGADEISARSGADECIAKPFEFRYFLERVRFHLQRVARRSTSA